MIHVEQLNIPTSGKSAKKRSVSKLATPFVLCLTMALTSCAGRIHHIDVGAVPDDYRTRHPIVISEQDKTLDLPVGKYSHRLTPATGDIIQGFAQNYLSSNARHMTIMRPAGSGNAHAAKNYAQSVLKKLGQHGVSSKQVTIVPYEASEYGDQARGDKKLENEGQYLHDQVNIAEKLGSLVKADDFTVNEHGQAIEQEGRGQVM